MSYPWILTATGRKFHYGPHDPDEFYLPDIARSMSRMCRFNGHLSDKYANDIYSIAQHSVYVYRFLQLRQAPSRTYDWGLVHDAPEAYWIDIVSPLKSLLPEYKVYENESAKSLRKKYDILYDDDIHEYVKTADYQLLLAEAKELTEVPAELWDNPATPMMTLQEIDPDFYPWGPKKAREEFMGALEELSIKE